MRLAQSTKVNLPFFTVMWYSAAAVMSFDQHCNIEDKNGFLKQCLILKRDHVPVFFAKAFTGKLTLLLPSIRRRQSTLQML